MARPLVELMADDISPSESAPQIPPAGSTPSTSQPQPQAQPQPSTQTPPPQPPQQQNPLGQQGAQTAPQQPSAQTQTQPQTQPGSAADSKKFVFKPYKPAPKRYIAIAIIALVIIAIGTYAGIGMLSGHGHIPTSTIAGQNTIRPTTSISAPSMVELSACGKISNPGTYYLTKSVKYSSLSGSCISINASNVQLNCNGNRIDGSGPYTGVSPYSYGIFAMGVSNVSIIGCHVMNFSYGAYLFSANGGKLYLDNFSLNTVSNLALNSSSNLSVSQDYFSKAASDQGSVYVTNNSKGNSFLNNTVNFNTAYGIVINASGNSFEQNYISYSPVAFYCSGANGFPESNKGSLNTCYNSTGCGFVQCMQNNIPLQMTSFQLHMGQITTCGTINSPGSYSLYGDLRMGKFVNASNPLVQKELQPCINIKSNNVHLYCNGHTVFGAPIGINVSDASNVTLSDCNVNGSVYGIILANANYSTVGSSHITNSSYGMTLLYSDADQIENMSSISNNYGLYMLGSNTTRISNFTLRGNNYGAYLSSSFGNLFNNGVAKNNSNVDMYATNSTLAQNLQFTSNVSCGSTDALWVKCQRLVSPSLQYYPINSCGTLNKSGNYLMTTDLLVPGQQCITINANNVQLDCGGDSMIPLTSSEGPAISVIGHENVTIRNCTTQGFGTGVYVANSKYLTIKGMKIDGGKTGISIINSSVGTIANNKFASSSNSSLNISGSTGLHISNNTLQGGPETVAIGLYNSPDNFVLKNNESSSYVGLLLAGNSILNSISNNSANLNKLADYQCIGSTGAFDAQNSTVNYGASKIGCTWLAVIPTTLSSISCQLFTNPATYTLSTDAVYPYGATCFNAQSGPVTINCNGHTVYAPHGGTFASFTNGTGNMVRNCFLKGFSQPISAHGAQIALVNDTIISTNSSMPAVNISGGSYDSFESDNITAPGTGLYIMNSTYGTIKSVAINAPTAFALYKISGFSMEQVNSTKNSGVGMILSNSTTNYLSMSDLKGVSSGLLCQGNSDSASSNKDNGGILCSSENNCGWVSSSSATCPSGGTYTQISTQSSATTIPTKTGGITPG